MLSDVVPPGFLTPAMIVNLQKMAIFIALFHGPWFIQARIAPIAPRFDLEMWYHMHVFHNIDATIADAVVRSLQRYLWYLTEELVVFGFFDSELDNEVRASMANALIRTGCRRFAYYRCAY